MARKKTDPKIRLQSRLKREGECLVWTGYRMPSGHGQIRIDGKTYLTHRYAWELEHGTIPDDMEVCHHCDNSPCCREDHLFLGTHEKNMADMAQKERVGTSKLNPRIAAEIRFRYANQSISLGKLAKENDVSKKTIINVVKGRVWQHAGGPLAGQYVKPNCCPEGHQFDEGNTLWHRCTRRCRECHRQRENARYWARKAERKS